MVRWWRLCIDLVFAVVRLLFGWFWIGSECLLLCGWLWFLVWVIRFGSLVVCL